MRTMAFFVVLLLPAGRQRRPQTLLRNVQQIRVDVWVNAELVRLLHDPACAC